MQNNSYKNHHIDNAKENTGNHFNVMTNMKNLRLPDVFQHNIENMFHQLFLDFPYFCASFFDFWCLSLILNSVLPIQFQTPISTMQLRLWRYWCNLALLFVGSKPVFKCLSSCFEMPKQVNLAAHPRSQDWSVIDISWKSTSIMTSKHLTLTQLVLSSCHF